MGTPRCDPIRRRGQHFDQLCLIVLAVRARASESDAFAGQSTRNKSDLLAPYDAFAIMREAGDRRGLDDRGDHFARTQAGVPSQARKNSAR